MKLNSMASNTSSKDMIYKARNTCSEDMISAAYTYLFPYQVILTFNTSRLSLQNDVQIDLSTVIALANCNTFTLESKSREVFQILINNLNKTKCYLMRTGTVGGAGHFQLLRYVENQWEVYSTPTNNFKLTSTAGILLEYAGDTLQGNPNGTAIWGQRQGNSMISFAEMTLDFIIKATNFIAEYRRFRGTDDERTFRAMNYAANQEGFNPKDDYYNGRELVQASHSDVPLVFSQNEDIPKISKTDLKKILDSYKTSFFLLNMLIKIFSFGFLSHQSGTVAALRTLQKANQLFFTKDEIYQAINSSKNRDSKKTSRLSFFMDTTLNNEDNSGTNMILKAMKSSFLSSVN